MSAKQTVEIELHLGQVDWLEKMVEEHGLPDTGKAIRALIDFAMADGDQEQIFQEIRCLHC
ncbi:MAG: hypothetical protein AAF604_08485 [Acidobacteriota bacterium]